MTEMNNEEAVAYLQRRLRRAGVEKALLRRGRERRAIPLRIGPVTFDFDRARRRPE